MESPPETARPKIEAPRSLREILRVVGVGLAVIGAVAGVAGVASGWAPAALVGAGVALAGVALALRTRRRARFVSCRALVDWLATPASLVRRPAVLDDLAQKCMHAGPAVLCGRTGVGKSRLIRDLLGDAVRGHGLVPVVVDWSRQPSSPPLAVLEPALRWLVDPKSTGRGAWSQIDAHLACLRADGRIPLLVFDQFESYLRRDRAAEVPDHDFWVELARRIGREGGAQLLIVCHTPDRPELSAILDVLGRARPDLVTETVRVDSLAPFEVEQAFDVLEGSGLILHRDYGWSDLRARLVADLTRSGPVLPIRLGAVLRELGELPSLTLQSYWKRGGLEGVEQRLVYRAAVAAAHEHDVSLPRVAGILSRLSAHDGVTRCWLSLDALLMEVGGPDGGGRRRRVESVLRRLEDAGVLDARQGVRGEDEWALMHADLGPAARRVWQETRSVPLIARDLCDAAPPPMAGPLQWWSGLLPARLQLELLRLRLRGHFRYGSLRRYALTSVCRLLPLPLALVGYVAAADVGVRVPFHAMICAALDDRQWTVFRQPRPRQEVTARLRDARDALRATIEQRIDSAGRIRLTGPPADAVIDTFVGAQILAARGADTGLVGVGVGVGGHGVGILGAVRAADVRPGDAGWLRHPGLPYVQAEPLLWMGIALAAHPAGAGTRELLGRVCRESALFRFTGADGQTHWTRFPLVGDAGREASVYATALALQFMLDVSRLDAPPPACDFRDLIEPAVEDLSDFMLDEPPSTGRWLEPALTRDDHPGLAFQVGSALLQVSRSGAASGRVPRRIRSVITKTLLDAEQAYDRLDLGTLSSGHGRLGPFGQTEVRYSARVATVDGGSLDLSAEPLSFEGRSWALLACQAWLDRFSSAGWTHHAERLRARRLRIERLRGRLVLDLGRALEGGVDPGVPTWRLAEHHFTAARVAAALEGDAEPGVSGRRQRRFTGRASNP